ncbi:MAG: alpha/beta fold hydrolase [Pseudomonadota bacterium]
MGLVNVVEGERLRHIATWLLLGVSGASVMGAAAREALPSDPALSPLIESAERRARSAQPDAGRAVGLHHVDCWFDIPTDWPETRCYQMVVPMDHQNPASRPIQFPIVRFTPKQPQKGTYPVLHLGGGGPGFPVYMDAQGIADGSLWWNYQRMSLRTGRDLYVMDPRGVGMAEPRLSCIEYLRLTPNYLAKPLRGRVGLEAGLKPMAECKARLEREGIALDQFHSRAVARDVEALRLALGISKWHLYGVSYASRYAQSIARHFPDGVASMALDSIVFPQIRYAEKAGRDTLDAFRRAFKTCDETARCRRTFPDLSVRFQSVVRDLDTNPLLMTITHPKDFTRMRIALTGERLVVLLFYAIYDEEMVEQLPEIVASLEARNTDLVAASVREWVRYLLDEQFADAVQTSHFCREEFPFLNFANARANAAGLPRVFANYAQLYLAGLEAQCGIWAIAPAPETESQPVGTDIPILVLHGLLDPVLPASDLQAQMVHFTAHATEYFADIAHDVVSSSACAERMVGAFFDHGLGYRAFVRCNE